MIEATCLCAGKKRERDNPHRFLGVVCSVAVCHPGRAENLQFAKKGLHKVGRKAMERDKKQEHQQGPENEACEWRDDHGYDHFWPDAGVPFYDRPIAMRRGQRRSAKSADKRMTRTRGQAEPPRNDVPGERGDDRAKYRRHCDDVGVDQPLADCRSNRAAEESAGEIEKRRHRNRLPRRQDPRGNNRRDRIGSVVKAVAVFENDRCEGDGKKSDHAAAGYEYFRATCRMMFPASRQRSITFSKRP